MKFGRLAYFIVLLLGTLTACAIARGCTYTDALRHHSYTPEADRLVLRNWWLMNDRVGFSVMWDSQEISGSDRTREAFSYMEWRTEPSYRFSRTLGPALGFHVGKAMSPDGVIGTRVRLPHWPMLVILAVFVMRQFIQRRRELLERKRLSRGLCAGCGYDVRASSDRCPECGRPVDRVPASPSDAASL
jgi:hypothetical protein